MIILSLNIVLPVGTYQYNGNTWIVDSNKILKSKDYYPNSYDCVYELGYDSIGCILAMQLKGLARTIGAK